MISLSKIEALAISRCGTVGEAALFFLDRGVGLVVVSKGADGAVALSRGSEGSWSKTSSLRQWNQRSSKVEVRVLVGTEIERE